MSKSMLTGGDQVKIQTLIKYNFTDEQISKAINEDILVIQISRELGSDFFTYQKPQQILILKNQYHLDPVEISKQLLTHIETVRKVIRENER